MSVTPNSLIRALDGNDDWQWGQNLSSYNTGTAAIAEDLQTRLLSFTGNCPWALLFGVDWWNLLSSKNPAAQNGIILQTRNMILGAPGGYAGYGVTAINTMDAYFDPQSRALALGYDVATIFSTSLNDIVSVPLPS
jgi:hypothetical protein